MRYIVRDCTNPNAHRVIGTTATKEDARHMIAARHSNLEYVELELVGHGVFDCYMPHADRLYTVSEAR